MRNPFTRKAPARSVAVLRQIAGRCLQYPDASVLSTVELMTAALAECTGPAVAELEPVLRYLGETAPGELAEHYVAVFDTKPRRTLHLSWFTDGDTRRRGQTLAGLRAGYREHGFAPAEDELPDFLPVLLEFAAATRLDEPLARFATAMDRLVTNLSTMDTSYTGAVRAVLLTLPAGDATPPPEPPAELVGLGPFPASANAATTGSTR